MIAQGPIDRTPGRLVVSAFICLYVQFFLTVASFALEHGAGGRLLQVFAGWVRFACPLLILAAIAIRLSTPK